MSAPTTGAAPAGRDLQRMLKRLRKSVRDHGYAEAWSKESPLICLATDVKLTDTAAETVGTGCTLITPCSSGEPAYVLAL